mgnify:CR=1 FL=1
MSLTARILTGIGLGIVTGLILNFFLPDFFTPLNTYVFEPLGKIFVNLIKMLVIPIVFVSLVLGTAGISEPKKLGRIGIKTIAFFLATTAIAIFLALVAALIFKPGVGNFQLPAEDFEAIEAPPVMETLINMIPTNPITAMAEEAMLQVIVFSLFVGFAIARLGEKTNGLKKIFEQLNDILMYLVQLVMKYAPIGAFALIATVIGGEGLNGIAAMFKYFSLVVLVLILHVLIVYCPALSILGRMNPIKFFKGFSSAMIVAFSTSSSNATLPVSMRAAQDNLGVSRTVSGFVQPLGATINMDGTAIMQGVATVFIAQIVGQDLTIAQLLTVLLTATLASIGTAGAPGVGVIMLTMVLTSVGLPVEAIALVLGVDRLVDMFRTAVNITGDAVCAVIVDHSERRLEQTNANIPI